MRPFRFGVNLRSAGSRAEWADKARRLEDQGYAMLSVPDHLAPMLAPMAALGSAAESTTRLRIGTMVLNNDFRHPVLMAREAAALDVLSDGRLELGLGAGHMKSEYDEAGLRFDPGEVRVARLAEALVVVKRLLEGKPVTFAGDHYHVTDHTIYPRPVQQPRPPIFVGGNAPRVLRLAAREADIVGLTGISFTRGGLERELSGFRAAAVDAQVRLVREAAGDSFDTIELNALIQRVVETDDRRAAAVELAQQWPQLSADEILESPYILAGTVEEMAEQLQARRERWGISYFTTQQAYGDAFAPVVARLAGC